MHLIFSRSLNKLVCRAFIVSILAMISIGSQNYLFSSSASSLSYKLRSLCLRAILRQDSKSISNIITHTLISTSSVEYFDRDENNVRAVVLTEMHMRELTVYLVWQHRGQVERRPTKGLWIGGGHPCSVRALRFPICVHLHIYVDHRAQYCSSHRHSYDRSHHRSNLYVETWPRWTW